MVKKPAISQSKSPSQLITERIAELGDWRGETLAHVRKLIKEADPKIIEEWKWRGVPVWSDSGIVCTGESYKAIVKLTFAKGASIKDPKRLFNSSLDGNVRRAIDLHEGEKINESAFKELVRAAVKLNSKGRNRDGPLQSQGSETNSECKPMDALPLIVFDVNETLLDLTTMEPTFERIFHDKGAMRFGSLTSLCIPQL